jgi:hypothetical protein
LKCFYEKVNNANNKTNKQPKQINMVYTALNVELKTHRFDFSKEIENDLRDFARIHQYDERKQLKENWQIWINVEPNKTAIQNESDRLFEMGYKGDIIKKMFTSIRYYYMKKKPDAKEENGKQNRKIYISLSPILLELIDNHIINQIKQKSKNNICNFIPSSAYLEFCKEYQYELLDEIKILKDVLDDEEIINKFKKTYKNRYQTIKKHG